MNSRIITYPEKELWNDFAANYPTGSVLQSYEWGELKACFGWRPIRLVLEEAGKIVAGAAILKKEIPYINHSLYYAPRGLLVDFTKRDQLHDLLEAIEKEADRDHAISLKIDPEVSAFDAIVTGNLRNAGFIRAAKQIQPRATFIINLDRPLDELLAGFEEKTRYNIRLAEKKNLVLKTGVLEDFWKLMEETTARDKFHAHPKKYYEKMLEKLAGDEKNKMRVKLKVAYFENQPTATAIVGYFGDTATYLHGASSHEYRNLMAPYFLHWEIIKEAKNLGYKFYDFRGIDGAKWPGVTRFKKGFGGFEINYPGTFDLPINKLWYTIYNLARKIL